MESTWDNHSSNTHKFTREGALTLGGREGAGGGKKIIPEYLLRRYVVQITQPHSTVVSPCRVLILVRGSGWRSRGKGGCVCVCVS